MDPGELAVIGIAALLTSALTAVAGLGGGVILLAVLLLYLDPLVAVPLHGLIQLVSNGSRTWIQRRSVDPGLLGRFALLLVPGSVLGVHTLNAIPPAAGRIAIASFALLATWWPRALTLGLPTGGSPRRRFVLLGGVVGFATTTLGAAGPLLGPFFAGIGLSRQAVVGTFAACQSLGHAVKIALFGLAGFAFAPHAALLVVAAAGVVGGTTLGSRLLESVSEATFRRLYRVSLTGIALYLILAEAVPLLR